MRQRRFFAPSRAGGEDVAGRRRETPSAGKPGNASAAAPRPSGRFARLRLPAGGCGGTLPRTEIRPPLEEQDRPRSDTQFGSALELQSLFSAPSRSAVAAADESRPERCSASYRPRSRLSLQAGIALPAEGPARLKVSWFGNSPRPASRRSRRVGKSAEADDWPPPAVGDRLSAMLSVGRICRRHAGRKRFAPVPALTAAGRRGRFAPVLAPRPHRRCQPASAALDPAVGTANRCLRCR
jgi:hypothetical protein